MRSGGNNNNNNEVYLQDHTGTYSIAKAIFRNQNYNTGIKRFGQLVEFALYKLCYYYLLLLNYFDNNLSRTSKQAEMYFMNCILINYLEEFISSLIKPLIGNWVIFGIRVLTLL